MSFNFSKTFAIIILQNFLWSLTVNISGIISDFETQGPIDNANVFIKNQDIGTITNQDGYFLLPIEKANQTEIILNISVIGYKEKEILVDLIDELGGLDREIDLGIVFMNKKPIELDALEIHSHKNESAQISDILITGSDLNQNLKGNIATTLSNYPNIGMNSFGS
ncbi:MAG: hypothetical protein CMG13_01855, partial [Candidatus Marinimicrobia bacterium]|nr:hypothetical protein [Candidatus Neomarinimicrobiota bacterium]